MEAVLHERRGGWADAMQTVRHLAERARAAGAEIREGVEVTGFEPGRRCVTSAGRSSARRSWPARARGSSRCGRCSASSRPWRWTASGARS